MGTSDDDAFTVYTGLTTIEGGGTVHITRNNSERGNVSNDVVFRMHKANDPLPKRGTSFETDLSGQDKKVSTLIDMGLGSLIQKLYQFDDMVIKEGAVDAQCKTYEHEIDEHLEKEAAFLVKYLENGNSLSDEDDKSRKKNKKELEKSKENHLELIKKVFTCYESCVYVRRGEFSRAMTEYCHTEIDDLEVRQLRTIKEAYATDSSGNFTIGADGNPTGRTPEHDDKDPAPTGYKFKWSYDWFTIRTRAKRGQTWDTFLHCRNIHLLSVFTEDGFGMAEKQYSYLMNGLKIPPKMIMTQLHTFVRNVSSMLYLMPSRADHPGGAYKNLKGYEPRNVALSPAEEAQALFNACPYDVQKKYQSRNQNAPIPTNPESFSQKIAYDLEAHWRNVDSKQANNTNSKRAAGAGKSQDGLQKPRTPKKVRIEKHCAGCKNAGKQKYVYSSHNTNECTKFYADGKPKNAVDKKLNAHALTDEGKRNKRKKKKKKKAKKAASKKEKKKKKKKKKSRYVESSSSGSSDDSDASSSSSGYSSSDSD